MYAEYLFPLGYLCGLSRDDIGGLTLTDFARYTDAVDAWIKAQPKPRPEERG